jgi:hypothetical protein
MPDALLVLNQTLTAMVAVVAVVASVASGTTRPVSVMLRQELAWLGVGHQTPSRGI